MRSRLATTTTTSPARRRRPQEPEPSADMCVFADSEDAPPRKGPVDVVGNARLDNVSAEIDALKQRLQSRAIELDRLCKSSSSSKGGGAERLLLLGATAGQEGETVLRRRLEELGEANAREKQQLETKLSTVMLNQAGELSSQRQEFTALQARLTTELGRQQEELTGLRNTVGELRHAAAANHEAKQMQQVVDAWQAQAVATQRELIKATDQLRVFHHERNRDRGALKAAKQEAQQARAQLHVVLLELEALRQEAAEDKAQEEEVAAITLLRKEAKKMKEARDAEMALLRGQLAQCEAQRDQALQASALTIETKERQLQERETELELVRSAYQTMENQVDASVTDLETHFGGVLRERDDRLRGLEEQLVAMQAQVAQLTTAREEAARLAESKAVDVEKLRAEKTLLEEVLEVKTKAAEEAAHVTAAALTDLQEEADARLQEAVAATEVRVRRELEETVETTSNAEKEALKLQHQQELEQFQSLRDAEQDEHHARVEALEGEVTQWRGLCEEAQRELAAETEKRAELEDAARVAVQKAMEHGRLEGSAQLLARVAEVEALLELPPDQQEDRDWCVRLKDGWMRRVEAANAQLRGAKEETASLVHSVLGHLQRVQALLPVEDDAAAAEARQLGPYHGAGAASVEQAEGALEEARSIVDRLVNQAAMDAVKRSAAAAADEVEGAQQRFAARLAQVEATAAKAMQSAEQEWARRLNDSEAMAQRMLEDKVREAKEAACQDWQRQVRDAEAAVRAEERAFLQEREAEWKELQAKMLAQAEVQVCTAQNAERAHSLVALEQKERQFQLFLETRQREHEQALRDAVAARNREWVERWDAALRDKAVELETARCEARQQAEEDWHTKVGAMLLEKERYYTEKDDKLREEMEVEAQERDRQYKLVLAEASEQVETAARELHEADERVAEALQEARDEVWGELQEREIEVCELRERLLQAEYDLSLLATGTQQQQGQEERPHVEARRPEQDNLFFSSSHGHSAQAFKLEERPPPPPAAAASPTRPPKAVLGQLRSALLDGNAAQFRNVVNDHPTLDLAETGLFPFHLCLQGLTFHGDTSRALQTLEAVARHEMTTGSDSLLAALDARGDSVLHALFKHVGTASALMPILEKLLSLAASMASHPPLSARNAEGKIALELCVSRALTSPEALSALRRLLELPQETTGLLSYALVQATNQQKQQQTRRRCPTAAAGKGNEDGGSSLLLEVLSVLAQRDEAGWDAQWKDRDTGKGQGELLDALAPSVGSNDKLRFDKMVRAALCKGVLVCVKHT